MGPRSLKLGLLGLGAFLAVERGYAWGPSREPSRAVAVGVQERDAVGAQPPTDASPWPVASSPTAPGGDAACLVEPGAHERWTAFVRGGCWREAAEALAALSDVERERPELRFVRARVAVELRSWHEVRALLTSGLEAELPLLAGAIRRMRAEAELEVGSAETAAALFAKGGPEERLLEARALQRAGRRRDALAAATRLITTGRRRGQAPEARALRAELLEQLGEKARAAEELRWLALNAVALSREVGAAERLAILTPSRRLTTSERLTRARRLAEDGDVDGARAELDALRDAPGRAVPASDVTFTLALALHRARRDAEALALFDELGKGRSSHRSEAAFLAARSLSRLGRSEEAVARYRELAERTPQEPFAARARVLAAEAELGAGRWTQAVGAFEALLARPRARSGALRGAERLRGELALARYGAGDFAGAARDFASLGAGARGDARARWRELEGAALVASGEPERARARLAAVLRDAPGSFAALAARARLAAQGEPVPPAPERSDARAARRVEAPSQPVTLPPEVALLSRLGLDRDAEAALRRGARDFARRHAPRGGQALCAAFALVSRPEGAESQARASRQGDNGLPVPPAAPAPSVDCAFPRPFAGLVEAAAQRWGLPAELLYAVMRQESGFRVGVVSPAGATGLMQLMPETARRIASERGLAWDEADLVQPARNIEFGAFYLARLLQRFGGNLPVAVAAYNAGPVAVARWVEARGTLPLDVWVATIPYAETRAYVASVLLNTARYLEQREAPKSAFSLPLTLPSPALDGRLAELY